MGPMETKIILSQCDLAMEFVDHDIAKWEELLRNSRFNRRNNWRDSILERRLRDATVQAQERREHCNLRSRGTHV